MLARPLRLRNRLASPGAWAWLLLSSMLFVGCRDSDSGSELESTSTRESESAQASALELEGASSDEELCDEHHVPEDECGICRPQLAIGLSPGEDLKVRFESLESASKAGIQTVPAGATEAEASISVLCEVAYNQNKLARITPLASGLLRRVYVDVGSDVEAGEVLLELHSADVASAKAAYISAVVDLNLKAIACERERRLAQKKISSDREVQEADAARSTAEFELSATRQRLLNYGFTSDEVVAIAETKDSSATLLVRAPYGGTIVRRLAAVGELVEPGDELLTLANLETMWLSLSVPTDEISLLEKGLPVKASFEGFAGLEILGTLSWISTAIDERTRMLKARATVDNSRGVLKAGMFGEARLILAQAVAATSVPAEAIQSYEHQTYVFVKLTDDLYSLRRVALVEGARSEHSVAIRAGLAPGEPVVTVGGFTVMSEFQKSRLGAGCVDD